MSRNKANVDITATNKMKAGLQDAVGELGNFGKIVDKIGKLTIGAGLGLAIKKIGDAAVACTENFMETEDAYLRMAKALNKQDYDHALESIDKFSKKTKASRDEIAVMISTLSSLGKSTAEIDKISEAAIALANVTGKDLNSSMEIMLDSLNGSTGEIEKYLPQVKDLTEEEKKLGLAIDEVITKFGGLSTEISGDSFSQTVKNIKDSMDSIGESIGAILSTQLSGVFDWIEERLSEIDKHIKTVKELTQGEADVNSFRDKNKTAITSGSITKERFDYYYKMVMEQGLLPALRVWKDTTEELREGLGDFGGNNPFEDNLLTFISMVENRNAEQARWEALDLKYKDEAKAQKQREQEAEEKRQQSIWEKMDEWAAGQTPIVSTPKVAGPLYPGLDLGGEKDPLAGLNLLHNDFGISASIPIQKPSGPLVQLPQETLDKIEEIEGSVKGFSNFIEYDAQDAIDNLNTNKEFLNGKLTELAGLGQRDSILYKNIEKMIAGIDKNVEDIKEDEKAKSSVTASLGQTLPELWKNINGDEAITSSISGDISGSFGELFSSIQPLIQLFKDPLWTMFAEIMKGFVSVIGPAVDEFLEPLFTALQIVGQSLGEVFIPILEALEPILRTWSRYLIYVGGVLKWLGDWVRYIFVGLANALRKVNIFGWHPFGEGQMDNPTPDSNPMDTINGMLNRYDNAASGGTSTDTAISNASYSGGTSVTINIYQNAPVVGEKGMDEFAMMIKEKFVEFGYTNR